MKNAIALVLLLSFTAHALEPDAGVPLPGQTLTLSREEAIRNARRIVSAETENAALKRTHVDRRVVFVISVGALLVGAAAGAGIGYAASEAGRGAR